jgi:acyl carrier protein
MTEDEALTWIAGVFNEPAGSLKADDSREAVAGWDSLGVLLLLADLDEKFGIQLEEREMEDMQSLRDILNVLKRHGKLV